MPKILGYRESHKALIGRAGLPGAQDADFLAIQESSDDRLGVQGARCFHLSIFNE